MKELIDARDDKYQKKNDFHASVIRWWRDAQTDSMNLINSRF